MSNFVEKILSKNIVLNIIFLLAFLFAAQKLYAYINDKGVVGYEGNASMANNLASASVMPAEQNGQNSDFATIDETNQTTSFHSSQNPEELLPNDKNNQWSDLNPVGSNPLNGVNLLNAGYHVGSASNPKRNSNLQMRPEIPNPVVNTGPWNQPVIEQSDIVYSKGFESLHA
jgi:hypothetical protein